MKKKINLFFAIGLFAFFLFSNGCKKDTVLTPGNLTANTTAALPEAFINIKGKDLQDIVSIKFDTVTAYFSSVFNTNETIYTNVPVNAKWGRQMITLTNRSGKSAQLEFTVIQPAPVINSFNPGSGDIAEIITVSGKYFKNIKSLKIGGTLVTAITDSTKMETLKFKIPAGATSGILTMVTGGGSIVSASTLSVGERAVIIADFDGSGLSPDGGGWYMYGDMQAKTIENNNPAPKSGYFLKAVFKNVASNGYAGISSYPVGNGFGLTSPAASTILKFDVHNNGKVGTKLQVIVQETTSDNGPNNFSKTVLINGTGWNTVSVRMNELLNNYGSGPATATPSNITKVKFHFADYNGVDMEANIDNVRFAY